MAQVEKVIEGVARAEFQDINLRHFNLNKDISTIEKKLEDLSKKIEDLKIEVDVTNREIHAENIKMSQDPTYKSNSLKALEKQRLSKEEKLGKLFSTAVGIQDSLNIKKEQLNGLHQDFSTKIPLGETVLINAREDALEDRKKFRVEEIDKKNTSLNEQKGHIEELDNVLDSAPLLKSVFNNMLLSYKNVLIQKALVEGQNPKVQEDIDKLKDLEDKYNLQKNDYQDSIENYSNVTGNKSLKNVDYKLLEKAMSVTNNPGYVFQITNILIKIDQENSDIEKEAIIEYYNEKLGRIKEQNTTEQNIEEQMPANNSLWNRFKQKFSNFISRFKRQQIAPTQTIEQTTEQMSNLVQDEYSEEFKEVLKESSYFKNQLKVTEKNEDKEIEERIAEAKRQRDAKKSQENDRSRE